MKKNTGTKYEELVQEIFQAILNFELDNAGYKRISVQHNVKLIGKSGCSHQVDVYWEFSLAGIKYITLVEVKDWSKPVKMEQLNSFKAVLDDIPGSPAGIYVSRNNYQSGALSMAKHHGIKLIEINEKQKVANILITHTITHYDGVELHVDEEWLKKLGIDEAALERLSANTTQESAVLLSCENRELSLIQLMCWDAVPYYYEKDNVCHIINKELDGAWFWLTGNNQIPKIKITGYTFQCHNNSSSVGLEVTLPYVVIKDILESNKRIYFSKSKTLGQTQFIDG
mgnify:CR=1 FL=1